MDPNINFESKWLANIEHILDLTGLRNVWECDCEGFSYNLAIERVWSNSCCTNYRIFKNKLEMEYYLVQLENKDRINLARFRCRSNQLPIINNRFKDGTYSDLFCHLCSENAIGDEYHYLFSCVFFKEERKRLVGAPYKIWLIQIL